MAQTHTPVRQPEDFLVFGAPQITDAEVDEVVATLRSGWLGTGPKVKAFEAAMAAYTGTDHAIAVNSCTAALHLSLMAAGVGPGDEVITTPMTFCATVNSIIHTGATPVLVDVDPVSFNIDAEAVARKLTPATKAILPVHFAGRSCAMEPLRDLAQAHDLKIIEDCAHAIETELDGAKAGTFGDFGCFSFYVTKNVVTGEGGMITTNDEALADRLRVLSLHGMSKDAYKRFGNEGFRHYEVVEPGFKYNMMDIQAAIGIHQLERVEANWLRRQEVWALYNEALAGFGVTLPAPDNRDARHAYHLYTILVDEAVHGVSRDDFLGRMTAHNIGVGVHYLSVPEHPYYQTALGWNPHDYPNAQRIGQQTVSLPIAANLSDGDVADVVEAVRQSLAA